MGPTLAPVFLLFALTWATPSATPSVLECTSGDGECAGNGDKERTSTLMQMARSKQGANVILNTIQEVGRKSSAVQSLLSTIEGALLTRAVIDEATIESLESSVQEQSIDPLLRNVGLIQETVNDLAEAYYNVTYNQSHQNATVQGLLEGLTLIEACIRRRDNTESEKKKACEKMDNYQLEFPNLCTAEYLRGVKTFENKDQLSPALLWCGTEAARLAAEFEPLRLECENKTKTGQEDRATCLNLYNLFSEDFCDKAGKAERSCTKYREEVAEAKAAFNARLSIETTTANQHRTDEYHSLNLVMCILGLMKSENSSADVAGKMATCYKYYDPTPVLVQHAELAEKEKCDVNHPFGNIEAKYNELKVTSPNTCVLADINQAFAKDESAETIHSTDSLDFGL